MATIKGIKFDVKVECIVVDESGPGRFFIEVQRERHKFLWLCSFWHSAEGGITSDQRVTSPRIGSIFEDSDKYLTLRINPV